MSDPDETTKVHVPHHNRAPVIEGEPAPTKRVWTPVEMQMRATLLAPMMTDVYEMPTDRWSKHLSSRVGLIDLAMAALKQ